MILSRRTLESTALNAHDVTGIVLRYDSFYGPRISLSPGGEILEMVHRRKFPLVGNGASVWSFIQIDDAAYATGLAVEHGPSGIYNIVDDDPAEAAVWLPELAQTIGAKPPTCTRLARTIGDWRRRMMTAIRGSSNAKAKRVLGRRPEYASWHDGSAAVSWRGHRL